MALLMSPAPELPIQDQPVIPAPGGVGDEENVQERNALNNEADANEGETDAPDATGNAGIIPTAEGTGIIGAGGLGVFAPANSGNGNADDESKDVSENPDPR